jgi:hypothetical protein
LKLFIKLSFLTLVLFLYGTLASAQYFASAYKPRNKTESLVIAKIRALPEVKDFYKYVQRNKPDFIINPPDSSNNCYAMQIGIDYGDIFRTHFWLLIDPKTFQVYYEDFDDDGIDIITLQQWRYWRTKPGYQKPHIYKDGKLVVLKDDKKKSSKHH